MAGGDFRAIPRDDEPGGISAISLGSHRHQNRLRRGFSQEITIGREHEKCIEYRHVRKAMSKLTSNFSFSELTSQVLTWQTRVVAAPALCCSMLLRILCSWLPIHAWPTLAFDPCTRSQAATAHQHISARISTHSSDSRISMDISYGFSVYHFATTHPKSWLSWFSEHSLFLIEFQRGDAQLKRTTHPRR